MAEAIGTALARTGQRAATDLPELSTVDWALVDLSALNDLPPRLDDRQLAVCEHIAQLPVPAMPAATEDYFLKCMRTLRLLPTRTDDDLSGELRLALYRRHFGKYPEPALSYLVEHATIEFRFFPTPQECKAVLDRWTRQDGPYRAQQLAALRARQERQARFEDVMARFRMGEVSQAEADQLPERWKRIAATQGYLREDGTFALRPIRGMPDHRGEAPLSCDDNTPGTGQEAPQPHERTDQ
jgi:hypothetical protein